MWHWLFPATSFAWSFSFLILSRTNWSLSSCQKTSGPYSRTSTSQPRWIKPALNFSRMKKSTVNPLQNTRPYEMLFSVLFSRFWKLISYFEFGNASFGTIRWHLGARALPIWSVRFVLKRGAEEEPCNRCPLSSLFLRAPTAACRGR